ncbi:hypothetical protein K1719_008365 [Acacia pycnantha]|nr:hypothetical protein K1719_008365 [Acacia pycnantha]
MAITKILEQCQVSAPPGSVPSTSLPLTYFDISWLHCHPIQRLFFFNYPHTTHHFLHALLPTLKHSLSLTLQHFFPFTGTLLVPPNPLHIHPYLLYNDGDSLPFTAAESSADFSRLVSDSPTDVTELHHLVPLLPSPSNLENGSRLIPLMTIQVTILPNSGLAIGVTFNHVAGDGRAFHHFMKFWASVCRARGNLGSLLSSQPLPCHTRDIIKDPKGLKLIYLKERTKMELAGPVTGVSFDKVRATFLLNRDQIQKLKNWVSFTCFGNNTGSTPHISTFVLTCSLVWICMIKSEESQDSNFANSLGEPCNLIFLADCRNHNPEFAIPPTYFGNCLATSIVALKRGLLVGEDGFVEAVKAMESKVRERKSDPLRGAETLFSDVRKLRMSGQPFLVIAGSPRFGVYETDFGWGKPRKSEVVHIDSSASISISDGRDSEVAIEIGVALRRTQMNSLADILQKQLKNITG